MSTKGSNCKVTTWSHTAIMNKPLFLLWQIIKVYVIDRTTIKCLSGELISAAFQKTEDILTVLRKSSFNILKSAGYKNRFSSVMFDVWRRSQRLMGRTHTSSFKWDMKHLNASEFRESHVPFPVKGPSCSFSLFHSFLKTDRKKKQYKMKWKLCKS